MGNSNADFLRLQDNLEKLDLERLKVMLDINSFSSVPNDWVELAGFLVKMERGKSLMCGDLLSDLARLIMLKISGFAQDKTFVKIFCRAPIADVIKFFKKFKVMQAESKEIK